MQPEPKPAASSATPTLSQSQLDAIERIVGAPCAAIITAETVVGPDGGVGKALGLRHAPQSVEQLFTTFLVIAQGVGAALGLNLQWVQQQPHGGIIVPRGVAR